MKTIKQEAMPKKIWAFKKMSYDVLLNEQTIPVPTVNIWDENNPEAVEYTDLSQIWHDASEEPKSEDKLTVVLIVDFFSNFWVCNIDNTFRCTDETWEDYVTCYQVNYWVYIKDLLPKGHSFFNKLI